MANYTFAASAIDLCNSPLRMQSLLQLLSLLSLAFLSAFTGTDLDECKTNPCGPGALCTNIPGGYECGCSAGYVGNPTPELGCVDVDECAAAHPVCGEEASCVNTKGGYFCQCPPGKEALMQALMPLMPISPLIATSASMSGSLRRRHATIPSHQFPVASIPTGYTGNPKIGCIGNY